MRKLLDDYLDEPIFNMKAVEQQTTIPAATLRAWERRYKLIEPKRTRSGYRLYSEQDVALLHWVRSYMITGLTISRIVAILQSMRETGEPIWIDIDSHTPARHDQPIPPSELMRSLHDALLALDDDHANEILDQAFAMYTMSTVYVEIIAPTLVEIGEAWHRDEIFISTEHFATTYLRGRLLVLLHAYPRRADMPMVFVSCAPTERHEVGALIFAVLLRQHGYNVIYLGQDAPIDDIVRAAVQERPALVCISASIPSAALLLKDMQAKLNAIRPTGPLFAYGGRAFDNNPDLVKAVPGYYLQADPREGLNIVNDLLLPRNPTDRIH